MGTVFLYGTLRHAPLLGAVLGHDRARLSPARLDGWRAARAAGEGYPLLVRDAGAAAEGILAAGLGPEDHARLAFYERLAGYAPGTARVQAASGPVAAEVFWPPEGVQAAEDWDLAAWAARDGALAVLAAEEAMTEHGRRPPEEVAPAWPRILARAESRRQARAAAPTTLRRTAGPDDLTLRALRRPYRSFFSVEEYDISWRRFDAGMQPAAERAVLVSGDAAVVLPYDPARDRVMLVEQFRPGPFARGDPEPWHLEPIAGRVDGGEGPEDAARREALEEAGLALAALEPIARGYPTPGAQSEFLHVFLALAGLPDGAAGLGGNAGESEDIRTHVVGFDRLMALVESGEAATLPLLLAAHWLARNRPRLRRGA